MSHCLAKPAFLETLLYSKSTKCWQEPSVLLSCCYKLSPRWAGKKMFEPENDFGRAQSLTIVAWLWYFAKYCTNNLRDGDHKVSRHQMSACICWGIFRLALCLSTIFLFPPKCMQCIFRRRCRDIISTHSSAFQLSLFKLLLELAFVYFVVFEKSLYLLVGIGSHPSSCDGHTTHFTYRGKSKCLTRWFLNLTYLWVMPSSRNSS